MTLADAGILTEICQWLKGIKECQDVLIGESARWLYLSTDISTPEDIANGNMVFNVFWKPARFGYIVDTSKLVDNLQDAD